MDQPNSILRTCKLLNIIQYFDFYPLHVQRVSISIIGNASKALLASNKHCKFSKFIIILINTY